MFLRHTSVLCLICFLLSPLCLGQDKPEKPKPDARFGNWLYKTPDPKVWKQSDQDGARVFSVDLPAGDFCTLKLFAGGPAEADFAKQFAAAVDRDQQVNGTVKIEADSGATASKSQEGFDVLRRSLRSVTSTLHTLHMYVAGHSGDRFDLAAFQTTSEETWKQYGSAAGEFITSLKLANSLTPAEVARLLAKGAETPKPPTIPGLDDAAPPAGGGKTHAVKSEVTARGPVGLYFMTRYSGGVLEKAAWYFTPEGRVYQNVEAGLGAADLAAHKGPKGTYQLLGTELEIAWADGTKVKTGFEPDQTDKNVFMWDMGIFTPVTPFDDGQALVGAYEGGESLSHGGNAVMVARSLEFKADGTYAVEGVASISGSTDATKLYAGSQGETHGAWKFSDGTVTLTRSDGAVLRWIAFPVDVGEPAKRLYCGGMLYKRK